MEIGNDMGLSLITPISKKYTDEQTSAEKPRVPAAATVNIAQHTGNITNLNLLEKNFVKNDSEPSKYIQGTLIASQINNEFSNKMQGIVSSYQAQLAPEDQDNYAKRVLIGNKAARAAKALVAEEVTETETTRLEKEREDSEKKAEENHEEKATGNSEKTLSEEAASNTENVVDSDNSSWSKSNETAVAQGEQAMGKVIGNSQNVDKASVSDSDSAQQSSVTITAKPSSNDNAQSRIDIVV